MARPFPLKLAVELELPTPLERAVAAACQLLTALERLEVPAAPAALVTRLEELLEQLTDQLPAVDELAAARETGDGLAQAAEQAAPFEDHDDTCACGETQLEPMRGRLVDGLWHGRAACVRADQ